MTSPPDGLVERLHNCNQQHLLRWWDDLDPGQRRLLLEQIDAVDFDLIARLLDEHRSETTLIKGETPADRAGRALPPSQLVRLPGSSSEHSEWKRANQRGKELLANGKVGAVLVAGGQGTRLGFDHPKGMYRIGPVSGCSLFQLLAEQLLARSRQAGAPIAYYIMTSDATHDETAAFFAEQRYFGLDPAEVFFFRQGNMPAVDAKSGRMLMAEKGRLCSSPDGHGGMLFALAKAGLLDAMSSRGIEYLFYHQVDNPTARVCDPAFLGFHVLRGSELSTKVVAKKTAGEPMGVVVDVDAQTQIIEYSDLPIEIAQKTGESGRLLLWAGSTAIHVFNRDLLDRLTHGDHELPFHVAPKKVDFLDAADLPCWNLAS